MRNGPQGRHPGTGRSKRRRAHRSERRAVADSRRKPPSSPGHRPLLPGGPGGAGSGQAGSIPPDRGASRHQIGNVIVITPPPTADGKSHLDRAICEIRTEAEPRGRSDRKVPGARVGHVAGADPQW
jgi:hypothetical protein